MTTSSPILPLELLESIVKEVSSAEYDYQRVPTLLACSHICKTMSNICRPHIFGSLHLVLTGHNSNRIRLLHLIDTLQSNPALLALIHTLSIDIQGPDDPETSQLSEAELATTTRVLLAIPNLHSLSLLTGGTHDPYFSPSYLQPFYHNLIDTFVSSKPTLHSLLLQEIPKGDTFRMIMESSYLHTLTLSGASFSGVLGRRRRLGDDNSSRWGASTPPLPYSRIRKLVIVYTHSFPLALLYYFPHLRSLHLQHVWEALPSGCLHPLVPVDPKTEPQISLQLEELVLRDNMTGVMGALVGLYLAGGVRSDNRRPFDELEVVELTPGTAEELVHTHTLIQDAPSLHSLKLFSHLESCEETSDSPRHAALKVDSMQVLRQALGSMDDAYGMILNDGMQGSSNSTVYHLLSIFACIANHGALQKIDIDINSNGI